MWLPYGRGTADGVTIASRDASLGAKGPVRSILSPFVLPGRHLAEVSLAAGVSGFQLFGLASSWPFTDSREALAIAGEPAIDASGFVYV